MAEFDLVSATNDVIYGKGKYIYKFGKTPRADDI